MKGMLKNDIKEGIILTGGDWNWSRILPEN
jgi:hypothetical protein